MSEIDDLQALIARAEARKAQLDIGANMKPGAVFSIPGFGYRYRALVCRAGTGGLVLVPLAFDKTAKVLPTNFAFSCSGYNEILMSLQRYQPKYLGQYKQVFSRSFRGDLF